ncbi:MAG TPA: PDZ domain-containing protein [Propioniciclava sp.]|jgi:PDZ domain-containing protein|uniref:YlbL family protein n=1 Tax=Propioniciclava sp. TaxID=2038686 RepID=UPI002B6F8B63|nr:PDZ domain-containing protein [Propioniciclava sp.]HRL50661.1 PDZ domain-containing protein [Propioniciclava sp.]HRL81298.1 PDZ domain-containing protein [Propioniciclava sp.]
MTRQTWTAAVSALIFVIAAAVLAMTPVPFVTYAPGATFDVLADADQPPIDIVGAPSYSATGTLLIASTSVTRPGAPVSLPEVLYAHAAADREVFPRDAVYAAGATNAEIRNREVAQLATAQSDAAAAALRAAGFTVRQVPMVQSVAQTGPAVDKLFPGDFVLEIDGVPTATTAAVRTEIEKRAIGDPVTFTVQRDLPDGTRERLAVKIDTTASKTQASLPVWGGNLTMGYSYDPRISFHLDSSLGGPTSGLILALGVYDRITPDNVVNGRVVSGAGTIDGVGNVAAVGGIKEKLVSAERAGAEVFFVPSGNCVDMEGVSARARIVSVSTLDDAINALDALADPATEALVKGCT